MSPEEIAQLRRRAEAGEAEALAFTAVLAGMGIGEPQSWAEARGRLVRAAELGSTGAEGQIAALAEAGDLTAWTSPDPERERLLRDPRITAVRGFLTPAICGWLIGRARGRASPALVYDPVGGGPRRETARSNSAFEFLFADLDLVTVAARARIAFVVGVPQGALEPMQVLHYAPGQTFERHHDFLDVSVPAYAAEVARSGQRIATFLTYLNQGYEGGETDFPLLGLSFKGGPGDALMFANIDLTGAPDRRTLHAGLPPSAGEKWLL
jgi:prolyl 4-hydroxylase